MGRVLTKYSPFPRRGLPNRFDHANCEKVTGLYKRQERNRAGSHISPFFLLVVLSERLIDNANHWLPRLHGKDSYQYCDDAEAS